MSEFSYLNVIYAILTVFIMINYGLLLQGIVGKISARVAKRIGIRIYQPWINIIRQWGTRTSITHGVMYYLGPVFRFSGGIGILLFVPIIYGAPLFSSLNFAGDLVLILYFMFSTGIGVISRLVPATPLSGAGSVSIIFPPGPWPCFQYRVGP